MSPLSPQPKTHKVYEDYGPITELLESTRKLSV